MKNTFVNKTHFQLWKTTYLWLKACGNRIDSGYCKEEITSHIDYPSLLSVIDFIESGNMAYQAVQGNASYVNHFNYPLLAHIREPGDEYMYIIHNVDEWEKQSEITKYWTGITIVPEENGEWNNEQNTTYLHKSKTNKFIGYALALAGFLLLSLLLIQINSLWIKSFGILSLAGLIISILALGIELGFQNDVVKKVCSSFNEGGCESVLKSRYAKGYFGITPADVAVFYFSTQFVVFLFSNWFPRLLESVFLIAICSASVVIWSIYIQAIKLRQWCPICLAIVTVLLFQIIISIVTIHSLRNFEPDLVFLVLLVVLSLVHLNIKRLVILNRSNKIKLVELKKWKLDANLFIIQWKQEDIADTTIWSNDLVMGNLLAPLTITVACSPYCGPCSDAHKELDILLNRFENKLKIQIRLLSNAENEADLRTIAVKAILQGATCADNNSVLRQMLVNWFEWMNYEKWVEKWNPNKLLDVSREIVKHSQWVVNSNISFTPTIFINGKKVPGRYSLNELGNLIPQLFELICKETDT